MEGSFACPECGREIAPRGRAPGREVICPACATRVEVPFLPRVAPRARRGASPERHAPPPRRRSAGTIRRRRIRRGLAAGAVVVVMLATWWAVGSIGARARAARERAIDGLVAASDAALAADDPAGACRAMASAVAQARRDDPANVARVDELEARRGRLARAEVQARLDRANRAGGDLDADADVADADALAGRARRDPALADLAGAIAARVEAAVRRQVEADRRRARAALDGGRGAEAFAAAARMHDHAARLGGAAGAKALAADARELVVATIARFGAAIDPDAPAGAFAVAAWREALVARGYLLPPAGSPWAEEWTAHAPFAASAVVEEVPDAPYLQSQNRTTRVDARFALARSGRPVWQVRVFARTREPIPDLPAYVAGKLATAARRDAEIERRLRDDARQAWRAQATRIFRGIPAPAAAPDPAPPPGPISGAGGPS